MCKVHKKQKLSLFVSSQCISTELCFCANTCVGVCFPCVQDHVNCSSSSSHRVGQWFSAEVIRVEAGWVSVCLSQRGLGMLAAEQVRLFKFTKELFWLGCQASFISNSRNLAKLSTGAFFPFFCSAAVLWNMMFAVTLWFTYQFVKEDNAAVEIGSLQLRVMVKCGSGAEKKNERKHTWNYYTRSEEYTQIINGLKYIKKYHWTWTGRIITYI